MPIDHALERCPHCDVALPANCPADEGHGCPWWEDFKEAQEALVITRPDEAPPRGRVLIVHDDTPGAMGSVLAAAMAGIGSAPIVIAGPPRKELTLPKLTLGVDLPTIPRNRRERRALRAGR